MRLCWNLLSAALLLGSLASGLKPPRSFYRRSYYSSVGPPGPVHLVSGSNGPPGYRADLQTNESKRRDVAKKYPKKTQYRPYTSEEDDYSSERYSGEYSGEALQDSREYTIGTQIRVQHPITVPKKISPTSPYSKQHKYVSVPPYKSSGRQVYAADVNSGEEHAVEPPSKRTKWTPAHYESEPDPFHLVPPPKATSASSHSYRVFESDHDDYDVPTRPKNHDRYKSPASKKQIDAFLEDQQKLLDEAIKLQLLNNPKLQKFLKSHSHEPRPELELEDFETFPPNFSGPGPLHNNNFSGELPPLSPPKGSRPHRRPPVVELKPSPKLKHIIKPKRKYRSALVISV
ncbi:extensin [Drosophila novamexicana]|uniref:extensin n=1 Tax=Drosophila novamexicana TaxID=47314 RepID=UPI0011E5A2C8|nr:extensin [Drosophila novamexicana]